MHSYTNVIEDSFEQATKFMRIGTYSIQILRCECDELLHPLNVPHLARWSLTRILACFEWEWSLLKSLRSMDCRLSYQLRCLTILLQIHVNIRWSQKLFLLPVTLQKYQILSNQRNEYLNRQKNLRYLYKVLLHFETSEEYLLKINIFVLLMIHSCKLIFSHPITNSYREWQLHILSLRRVALKFQRLCKSCHPCQSYHRRSLHYPRRHQSHCP